MKIQFLVTFLLWCSSHSFCYSQNIVILNCFYFLVEGIIKSLMKNNVTIVWIKSYESFIDCNTRRCWNMLKYPYQANRFVHVSHWMSSVSFESNISPNIIEKYFRMTRLSGLYAEDNLLRLLSRIRVFHWVFLFICLF